MRRDKELTIEITNKCTLSCKWCSSNSTPEGIHISKDKIFTAMRQMKPYCNVLRISGGEPLLHPDLRDIMYEAHRWLDYHVVLMTNGQDLLPCTDRDNVDEFVVHIVNGVSLSTVAWYQQDKRKVSMHVVAVEGKEDNIGATVNFATIMNIPVHVLALQKQGRGINCEPSQLITWSGEKGCTKNKKVTMLHDGTFVTCSALKSGRGKCDA